MTQTKEVKAHLGKLIARGLKARGILQKDFADQLDMHKRNIAYWTQGESWPSRPAQRVIEETLGWQRGSIQEGMSAALSGTPLSDLNEAWMAGQRPGEGGLMEVVQNADPVETTMALVRRLQAQRREMQALNDRISELEQLVASARDYDLAASSDLSGGGIQAAMDSDSVGEGPQ
ncbi:XRE family transcriptional regulator [Arthrobacter frigidicola]|nr:XRE family transcriptional regulator [Arthrobacter frigidicola]